ncbi:MAG: hypothetical protein ACI8RO_000345, partial [Flavobacteriales bacterium]
ANRTVDRITAGFNVRVLTITDFGVGLSINAALASRFQVMVVAIVRLGIIGLN